MGFASVLPEPGKSEVNSVREGREQQIQMTWRSTEKGIHGISVLFFNPIKKRWVVHKTNSCCIIQNVKDG